MFHNQGSKHSAINFEKIPQSRFEKIPPLNLGKAAHSSFKIVQQ